jgi:hypothetical protein
MLRRTPWTEHPYLPESVRFEHCRLPVAVLASELFDYARAAVPKASNAQRIMGVVGIKLLEHRLIFIETSSGLVYLSVFGGFCSRAAS